MAEAPQQDREREGALHKHYGLVLNTVTGMTCPICCVTQQMTVHPAHRVYAQCGHAFPLPPIAVTSPQGRAKTREAAK